MNKSGKANRINVSRIVYTKLLSDTSSGVTYGEIQKFGDPMQVQMSPTIATGILYGGGAKTEDIAKLTGMDLQLDVNKVPIEVRADIYNNTFENGVLTESKTDQANDIAIGIEVEQTGNKRELVWLLKGKPQPYANTTQQSTDSINFSTDSMKISFLPREYDGKIRAFGDTANPDFTNSMANIFLSSVPGTTGEIEQVETPVADPVAGEVETGAMVKLTCDTPGADIYYTTDDSQPENGTLYVLPIEIESATTIKAVALKDGMKTSEMLTAEYTIGE